MNPDPFELADERAYQEWRGRKLAGYPARVGELVVEVRDPRALSASEHAALLARCRRANMALYASRCGADPDKDIPRLLARQFGLTQLDANPLADDDGITPIAIAGGERAGFIPYTNRPIRWHTDGYYNPPARPVRAMVLHCVSPATEGGANRLLDHEIAYLLLRDEDPAFIRALVQADAMTIPARMDEDGVARPAQSGPVFSVDPASGRLHMRYTARTHSIEWKQDGATRAAAARLRELLDAPSPFVFSGRLEAGMGLLCNNVLHDRAAFTDSERQRRLLYRARYHDRIAGS